MRNLVKLFSILVIFFFTVTQSQSAEKVDYLKTDWSFKGLFGKFDSCLLYTSPSPRDRTRSRMPSSA